MMTKVLVGVEMLCYFRNIITVGIVIAVAVECAVLGAAVAFAITFSSLGHRIWSRRRSS
jgi:hypothetical protein